MPPADHLADTQLEVVVVPREGLDLGVDAVGGAEETFAAIAAVGASVEKHPSTSAVRLHEVVELRTIGGMGLLTFALNVTLDGCIDHRVGIADEQLHDYFTGLMDGAGAMLFGRVTYELMESAWPAVARDESAPRSMREWAQKLEAKPKYVVSSSRKEFPWVNTFRVEGDLRDAITKLKADTPRGVLVGAPKLAAALEELGLIDEYRIVIHPVLTGHGPTLFHGLSRTRKLELVEMSRLGSGVMTTHYRQG